MHLEPLAGHTLEALPGIVDGLCQWGLTAIRLSDWFEG